MDIKKALNLKPGDSVLYPEDRGSPGGVGRVVGAGTNTYSTPAGTEYIWVTVNPGGMMHESVWPSNRLERP